MTKRRSTKTDQYTTLRATILQEMKERGTYREADGHLLDSYINLCRIVAELQAEVDSTGTLAEGQRGSEVVTNPALVRLPSLISAQLQTAKMLGVGPYSRKLTTGNQEQAKKEETIVSQLRPIERKTKTN